MLPTEESDDERFEVSGKLLRGHEINSGNFALLIERQAHRQLAARTMQPERNPPGVRFAPRPFNLFDVAEICSEPSVKSGGFFERKRLAHLRVVELLHGGIIPRVEQITHFSSHDGVA